jgi:hypothetical protein
MSSVMVVGYQGIRGRSKETGHKSQDSGWGRASLIVARNAGPRGRGAAAAYPSGHL